MKRAIFSLGMLLTGALGAAAAAPVLPGVLDARQALAEARSVKFDKVVFVKRFTGYKRPSMTFSGRMVRPSTRRMSSCCAN